jgi:hypothetical protein
VIPLLVILITWLALALLPPRLLLLAVGHGCALRSALDREDQPSASSRGGPCLFVQIVVDVDHVSLCVYDAGMARFAKHPWKAESVSVASS